MDPRHWLKARLAYLLCGLTPDFFGKAANLPDSTRQITLQSVMDHHHHMENRTTRLSQQSGCFRYP